MVFIKCKGLGIALSGIITTAVFLTIALSISFSNINILNVYNHSTVYLVSPLNDSYTNQNNSTLAFTYNHTGALTGTVNCTLYVEGDAVNYTASVAADTNTLAYSNTTITEAAHNWWVNCTNGTDTESSVDVGGNWTINVDLTHPTEPTLIMPANNTNSTDNTPDLNWTTVTEDAFANYTVQVDDDSAFVSVDYAYNTTTITESNYSVISSWTDAKWYWRVIAHDTASNSNTSGYFVYITDTTEPTITLNTQSNESAINSGTLIGLTIVDALNSISTAWWSNNSGTENYTLASPYDINTTGWAEGVKSIDAWANDTLNHIQHEVYQLTIDDTPPNITFVNQTDEDNEYVNQNWSYVNVSIFDALTPNNITAFIDWNNSLVGWWRFNEGTGTNAQDFSSYGNNGTLTNMNTGLDNCTGNCSGWTSSGKFGNALVFDDVDDSVDCGNDDILDITEEITISVWIKAPSVSSGQGIAGKSYYSGAADNGGYEIDILPDGSKMILGNNDWDVIEGDIPVDDGVWHHCCYTWDGTNVRIYIDGILDITSPTSISSIKIVSQDLEIGVVRNNDYFSGTIDEVRIYNRVLSAEEINASYNAGLYRLYHNFTDLEEGTYTYTAYAQDLAGNVNQTETRTLTVDAISNPSVSLNTPINNKQSSNTTQLFDCSAADTNNNTQLSNITFYWNYSGTFIVNGTTDVAGEYNSTTFTRESLEEKQVLWNCYACDNSSNCGFAAANYSVTVDTTAPAVNLVAPENNTLESSTCTLTFTYNISDDSSIANCSLYIDSAISETDSTITKDTNQSFSHALANRNYNWFVKCFDAAGLEGVSDVYNLSVNYSGATYYVNATSGNDAWSGTLTEPNGELTDGPWKTIQHAADTAQAGDHVIVKAGIYNEFVTIQNSGAEGNPIIFEGERGAGGEWLTIVDPGINVSEGWVSAPEVGEWVYKTDSVSFPVKELTIDNKRVLGIYPTKMSDGSGFEILNTSSNETLEAIPDVIINWWDGIEAVWGYCVETNITYIRFRDGDNPNGMNIKAYENGNSMWSSVKPGISLYYRSNIIIRNFHVRGAHHSISLYLGGNNIIEDNYLTNGYARIGLYGETSNNTIRNNNMTMNYYGYDSLGAGSNGLEHIHGVRRHIYSEFKYTFGVSTSHDNCIRMGIAGDNNEIYGNNMYKGLLGISYYGYVETPMSNTNIYNNTIYEMSSVGITLSSGATNVTVRDNFIYDCNINIRIHKMNEENETDRIGFIYGNTFWLPEGIGYHIFCHWNEENASYYPTYWIYHNTFLGGTYFLYNAGRSGYEETHTLPNMTMVNNVISSYSALYFQSGDQFLTDQHSFGGFDYNWIGINNHKEETPWFGELNILSYEYIYEDKKYIPEQGSPVIDAGIDLSTDYSINNRTYSCLPRMDGSYFYGTPDIGAYEYQPPYNISQDEINTSISKNIRIYADGKYRHINSTTGSVNANLTVSPLGGFNSTNYSQWMDITINTWNTALDIYNWTENATGITNVTHMLSGLNTDSNYNITVNGTFFSTTAADASGVLNFTYNGTYSVKEFYVVLEETGDTTPPSIKFTSPTPSNGTITTNTSIEINVSITDSSNTTAFIDWNNSLVGWWRFNLEAGENDTRAVDWSGNGNNGTLTNMNTGIDNCTGNCSGWTANGKFGKALEFDAVDDYVDIDKDLSGNFSSITLEAWVNGKQASSSTNLFQALPNAVLLHFRGSGFYLTAEDETTSGYLAWSPIPPLNEWVHMVATWDGQTMKLYFNGAAQSTNLSFDGGSTGKLKSSTNLYIGEYFSAGNPLFNGTIDEVRIFNRALAPEEINASYNAGLYRLYHNFTNLTDDTYTYTAYAQDLAGNVNQTETRTLTVDTTETTYFNSTWNTSKTSAGSTNDTTIGMPLESGGTYNFTVWWGDGSNDVITAWNDSTVNHTYASSGEYNVSISGTIQGFRFNNASDRLKLIDISNWGNLNLGNGNGYFYGCENLEITAIDVLDLTGTTSFASAFRDCSSLTTVHSMNNWDMSDVTNMYALFRGDSLFNQNISNWNTSSVWTMALIFHSASSFNQDIGNWDTSGVTTMTYIFNGASAFNGNVTAWDTSGVTDMSSMFRTATAFNQDISAWNTSSLSIANDMFNLASSFNQDIGSWDMSQVSTTRQMFYYATSFNQNISAWNMGGVNTIENMFIGAESFDQDIGNWNISSLTDATDMFLGRTLSTANYNALLTGWEFRAVQNDTIFHGGNSKYSGIAATARAALIADHNWTITDGGMSTVNIEFASPTTSEESHFQSYIEANVTASATDTLESIVIFLYNSTGLVTQNSSITSPFFWNMTNLDNGTYYLNATANNSLGVSNSTETRTITLGNTTPPTVTLNTPTDNLYSSNTTQLFNCSATDTNDDTQLSNITFYWNYSGTFIANGTNAVTGEYNSTTFTRESLEEKQILWNCYACDNSSNCAFATNNYTITLDTTAPVVNLVAPGNNTVESSTNTITFIYNVSKNNSIANCSLYLNNLLNSTNTTITKDTNQTFAQTMSNGNYNWSVKCFDDAGLEGAGDVYNLSVDVSEGNYTPIYSKFNGSTTNFTQYNETEIQAVSDAILEITAYGKIKFLEAVNFSGADLDSYVFIETNNLGLDSSSIPNINKSANITFYNVSFVNPVLSRESSICQESDCTLLENNGVNITYNVTHFSNYSISEISNSTITRTLSSSAINKNDVLTVTLNVTIDNSTNETFFIIDEIIPENFTVVSAGGGNTSYAGHIRWAVIENANSTFIRYSIKSDVAGNRTFNGTYMFENMTNEVNITPHNMITVRDVIILSDKTTYKCYPLCTAYINLTHAENSLDSVHNIMLNNTATKPGIPFNQQYNNGTWQDAEQNNAIVNNYNFSKRTHEYKITINLSEPTSAKWNFSVTVNGVIILLDPYIDSINLTSPDNNTLVGSSTDFNFTLFADGDINQTCDLWLNGTAYGQTYALNATPATINMNATPPNGLYNWNISCTNDLNETGYSESRVVNIDATSPVFSNYQRNPNLPNEDQDIQVNVTVTEDNIDTIIFEWNGTTNYTVTTHSGNEYYFTVNQSNYTAHDPVTYSWYANDSAGNMNKSAQQSFTVANRLPSISAVSITPEYPKDTDNIVCSVSGWSDADAEDTASYYYVWHKNDTINITILSTQATNTLYSGNTTNNDEWNCTVVPYDGYGNGTEMSDSVMVLPYGPPSVVLNTPVNNYNSSNTTQIFNCSTTDDNSLVNITLYGNWSGWGAKNTTNITGTSNSSQWINTLSDGTYIWNCKAEDNTGNASFASSNHTLTIDTTPPIVFLDSPANNSWAQSNSITFKYTPQDANLASCTLYHNASGWAANTTNSSVLDSIQSEFTIALSDNPYLWNINCTDSAGNSAFNTTNSTINIDATMSAVSFSASTAQNDSYFNRDWIYANVSVTEANEKNITFALYNTSSLVNSTTSTGKLRAINWTGLPQNTRYYYNATVIDYATNTQSTETRRITLDSIVPNISITAPSNNTNTTDPTPLIQFNITDNLAEIINYSVYINNTLNGQAGQGTGLMNITLSGLNLGSWLLKFNALDQALNTQNSTEIFITILPPAVYLAAPADNAFTDKTSINFTFNVSDPEFSNINCSLYINGTYIRSNTSTANYTNTVFAETGLSEGNSQIWLVHCINPENNTGNNTKIFNIDLTSPVISYASGTKADNAFTNTKIFVNISAYDLNEANITFRLYNSTSGVNTTTYTSPVRAITWKVPDGIYFYNTTITDAAGHLNTTQARTIILDTAAPAWSNNAVSNKSGNYYFNITWADTNPDTTQIEHNFTGTFANYTVAPKIGNVYQYNYTGLQSATYAYRWYANDSASNINSTGRWIIYLPDITSPVIAIISPVNESVLTAGTTSTMINITTDENAACRHNTTNLNYGNSTNFTITGNLSHAFFYDGLSNGNTYNLYYWCNDTAGNINANAAHHVFSISSTALYCGDGSCNNGETCSTCSADCGTCSSGGGGGSIVISTAIPSVNTITVSPGEPLTKITVNFRKSLSNPAIITVTMSSIAAPAPAGILYRYVNITKQNFDNPDIKNATIVFGVNKSWISENNISKIYMTRYNGTAWIRLNTMLVTSTGGYNEYVAHTSAFSYFAILGEAELPVVEENPASTNKTASQINVLEGMPDKPRGWSALIITVLVIAAGYIYYLRKKKHDALHKDVFENTPIDNVYEPAQKEINTGEPPQNDFERNMSDLDRLLKKMKDEKN